MKAKKPRKSKPKSKKQLTRKQGETDKAFAHRMHEIAIRLGIALR